MVWARLLGKLPPGRSTPSFKKCLATIHGLDVDVEPSSKSSKKVLLDQQHVEVISYLLKIPQNAIDPNAVSMEKVSSERQRRTIVWQVQYRNKEGEEHAYSANYVCWLNATTDFKKHITIEDQDDIHFGSIAQLYIITAAEKNYIFASVDVYSIVHYKPFGEWVIEMDSPKTGLLPLSSLSEPLYVGRQVFGSDSIRHVLNSKVRLGPMDRAARERHLTPIPNPP